MGNGTVHLPTDDLLEENPLWKEKLQGYAFFRGEMVVTVQLNATPFQQGKILIHFLPLASRHFSQDDGYIGTHNTNIHLVSSQHNVELDCRETAATLRIPYLSPFNWYRLWKGPTHADTEVCERGRLYMTVQAALRSISDVDCGFSVWAHWENVELAGPIVPQGRFSGSIGESEEKAMHDKTLSSGLRSAGSIAGALSAIPAIAAVAGPASWALDRAAGLASALGYSKPRNDSPYTVMMNQPFRYAACGAGESSALPLGLKHDFDAGLTDDSFSGGDEMSFAYLKKVPVLHEVIPWTTSNDAGTLLFEADMTPSTFCVRASMQSGSSAEFVSVTHGDAIYNFHPHFKHWRGSREIELRIARTDLHSGRLQIVFCPRGHTTDPTFATAAYALREVVDIREKSTVKFTLPYIAESDYLTVDQSLGTLQIYVSTELRAPDTVSQTVDMSLWTCAGDDFQFQTPAGGNQLLTPICAQALNMEEETAELGVVGDAVESPLTTMEMARCIGEDDFTSIRSLLLQPTRIWQEVPFTDSSVLTIRPYWMACMRVDNVDGSKVVTSNGGLGGDMYSWFAGMYACARGGMRLLVEVPGADLRASQTPYPKGTSLYWYDDLAPSHVEDGAGMPYWKRATGPRGVAITGESRLQVELPYYNRYPRHVAPLDAKSTYDSSLPGSAITFYDASKGTDGFSKAAVYRSIAEDHQLIGFCGFMPLWDKEIADSSVARARRRERLIDIGRLDPSA
jgi:hypothetical protein